MDLRRVILRVLLASLGLAAAAGAAGILLGGSETLGRIAGTAGVTALAALVLMPVSTAMDKAEKRQAALMAMVVTLILVILALALIWGADGVLSAVDEELLFTFGVVFLTGVTATFYCRLLRTPVGYFASRVGLGLTVIVLLIWLIATWMPYPLPQSECWETGWTIGVYGVLATFALVGLGHDMGRHWRWIGVGGAVLACLPVVIHIWASNDGDPWFIVAMTSAAVAVAHANLITRAALPSNQRWLLWATIGAVVAAGLLATLASTSEPLRDDGPAIRLAGAATLLAACGTLGVTILARLHRKVDFEPGSRVFTEMEVICPRCRRKQAAPLGRSQCAGCGLRMAIEVEEPRCDTCGYLLYGAATTACPECGTAVGHAAPQSAI